MISITDSRGIVRRVAIMENNINAAEQALPYVLLPSTEMDL